MPHTLLRNNFEICCWYWTRAYIHSWVLHIIIMIQSIQFSHSLRPNIKAWRNTDTGYGGPYDETYSNSMNDSKSETASKGMRLLFVVSMIISMTISDHRSCQVTFLHAARQPWPFLFHLKTSTSFQAAEVLYECPMKLHRLYLMLIFFLSLLSLSLSLGSSHILPAPWQAAGDPGASDWGYSSSGCHHHVLHPQACESSLAPLASELYVSTDSNG